MKMKRMPVGQANRRVDKIARKHYLLRPQGWLWTFGDERYPEVRGGTRVWVSAYHVSKRSDNQVIKKMANSYVWFRRSHGYWPEKTRREVDTRQRARAMRMAKKIFAKDPWEQIVRNED